MELKDIKFKISFNNGDVAPFTKDYFFVFRFQWLEVRRYPEKNLIVVYHSNNIKKVAMFKNGKELI